ncbi:hypothetical protein [Castellaniella sp.]|uniref:hypothetical protein n=1 Tax=Castellaniella sp. TaxID=1955812 RepID=UPI003C73A50E
MLVNPEYAPITNACNYRIRGNFDYNVSSVSDGDPSTGMNVYCSGWVIFTNPKKNTRLSVKYKKSNDTGIKIEYAQKIGHWNLLGNFSEQEISDLYVPPSLFVRVSFNKDIQEINEISMTH